MLTESTIISLLKAQFPHFIGDDAAVLPFTEECSYVVSKDVLVEGVHFRRTYFDADSLAYKALQVNLSDLAAMGAEPKYVLLGLSLPELEHHFLTEFLNCFAEQCKQANVILVGGDTTRSDHTMFISVTVIGTAKPRNIKWRRQAQSGDIIAVAGDLGYAHVGWKLLELSVSSAEKSECRLLKCNGYDEVFKQACLRPRARLSEGQWCALQKSIHACMDLSDGLLLDAEKMALASNLAAYLDADAHVPDAFFIKACQIVHCNPHAVQITGGEDYGLLLSIDPQEFSTVSTEFKHTFGYDLKKVGCMMSGRGVHVFPDSFISTSELQSFTHFGK